MVNLREGERVEREGVCAAAFNLLIFYWGFLHLIFWGRLVYIFGFFLNVILFPPGEPVSLLGLFKLQGYGVTYGSKCDSKSESLKSLLTAWVMAVPQGPWL